MTVITDEAGLLDALERFRCDGSCEDAIIRSWHAQRAAGVELAADRAVEIVNAARYEPTDLRTIAWRIEKFAASIRSGA